MTEKEAIEQLYDIMIQFEQDISEAECGDKYAIEAKEDSENALKALDIAINALKEIQQYREIGTVEECREAVEKRHEKPVDNRKVLKDFHGHPYSIRGDCPACGYEWLKSNYADYCPACGQKLEWEGEEE
ncbi:MAG TPA: hypothetical protein IAA00_10265 [Candidatus Blautia ornithocaccae]|nr:hypothetical protein [Candidatus Blautia ornithocaccae]